MLWFIISHGRQWPKADQAETSWIIWQTSLEFFCQEFYYIYCIRLQWINTPFTKKVCLSFECTAVSCFGSVYFHASDIIASASDKIDGVDRTDLRLIRINDYRWWDCKFHDSCKPWLCIQSGTITIVFLHSSWIFCSILRKA